MKHKDRLITAINHKEPDRVPIDIGQTAVTGVSQFAYGKILEMLGIKDRKIIIYDIMQQLAKIDEDILLRYGVDMRGVYLDPPKGWSLKIIDDGEYTSFIDAWNVKWRMPKKNGYYYDFYEHPLRGDNLDDIDEIKYIDPLDRERVASMIEDAKKIKDEGEYASIMAGCGYTVGYLQQFQWLQGFEDSYINIAGNEKFTRKLLDKLENLEFQFWDWFLREGGENIDIMIMSDDYSGQNCMLISPEHFRKYFKPMYIRLFKKIKTMAHNMKIFFHSCGAIYEIIPDIIEMGVDILNPLQFNAKGMDLKRIKKEFGKDLTFWGGAADPKSTLPFGTPKDVKEEVKKNLDILMSGGGYIFNTIHDIQRDVPPENAIALWETALEYGKY